MLKSAMTVVRLAVLSVVLGGCFPAQRQPIYCETGQAVSSGERIAFSISPLWFHQRHTSGAIEVSKTSDAIGFSYPFLLRAPARVGMTQWAADGARYVAERDGEGAIRITSSRLDRPEQVLGVVHIKSGQIESFDLGHPVGAAFKHCGGPPLTVADLERNLVSQRSQEAGESAAEK